MSVFEEFMSDAKVLANKASRKVNETYEISKLKAEKLRIQSRIDASYQSLGEAVYAHNKSGEDINKVFETLVGQLDEDFEKISEIYQEIEKVKTIYGSYDASDDEDDEEEEALEKEIDEEEEYCEECDDEEETEETTSHNDGIELEAD